jgi:hypothetical protein
MWMCVELIYQISILNGGSLFILVALVSSSCNWNTLLHKSDEFFAKAQSDMMAGPAHLE